MYNGYEHHIADDLPSYKKIAITRLKTYGNKAVFVEKMFQDAVNDLPSLDFVYYDIWDNVDRISCFLKLYYPKIRSGGVVGGWNYDAGHSGVSRAVVNFVDQNHLQDKLDGVGNDWWIKK